MTASELDMGPAKQKGKYRKKGMAGGEVKTAGAECNDVADSAKGGGGGKVETTAAAKGRGEAPSFPVLGREKGGQGALIHNRKHAD